MLEIGPDISIFILELLSYLSDDESITIYFRNSNNYSQSYKFKATTTNIFIFTSPPNINMTVHASIVKYILPPSTSISEIYIELYNFQTIIYFNKDLDEKNIKKILDIVNTRLEYMDFLKKHEDVYEYIHKANKAIVEKEFKNFVRYLNSHKYNLLSESKKITEKSIEELKNMLDNPYLEFDRELVRNIMERTKRRLKFMNIAISELEKISYPVDKPLPQTIFNPEIQICESIKYVLTEKNINIIDALIFGGCIKHNISPRNLKYAWEDLEKVIHNIDQTAIKSHVLPNAVTIYDELVNKVKKCYYSGDSANFLVDFYKLGSCNCQCGTYMLYQLFQMYPDPGLKIFAKIEPGHIKILGVTPKESFYNIETTSVANYLEYISDVSQYMSNAWCFIFSPFVLSCAYIVFDMSSDKNLYYENMVHLPIWTTMFSRNLESYFEHLSLNGVTTLADVDSLFVITLLNIYNKYDVNIVEPFVQYLRPHFISDIKRVISQIEETEEALEQRKYDNIKIFSEMMTKRLLEHVPYKEGEEMIETEAKPEKENLKLKLREKIKDKEKERKRS